MKDYIVTRWNYGDDIPSSGILLIRHGPREGGNFPGFEAGLTEGGREACRVFGSTWNGSPPATIFVSSVTRCRETGELIREAAGWDVDVADHPLLGDPGPFVTDGEAVRKISGNYIDWSFLLRHIKGEEIPGMIHRDVGSRNLILGLRGGSDEADLVLAISHDSIIAAVIAHGSGNPDPWPEPLCGAIIEYDPSSASG